MTKPHTQVIPQQAFDWYDEYAHGDINRRTFMSRLSTLALSATALSAMAIGLTPDYVSAEQVSFNDPDIIASYHPFQSPQGHGSGQGYLVKPAHLSEQALLSAPRVLVVHENRGLNPYIKDVTRRLAKAGYLAFAPDALFVAGGYPGNDDKGRDMQRALDRNKIEQDFIAAARFLKTFGGRTTKLGVVGFCFGGYMSNFLAAAQPDVIDAAVPFYGSGAPTALIPQIRGPLMLHFAELDTRVNATWPAYQALLDEHNVPYTVHTYAKVNHGFHNDSTSRYAPEAAELAWRRTLAFFKSHLN